jgi:trimeric autotransporter adhesin
MLAAGTLLAVLILVAAASAPRAQAAGVTTISAAFVHSCAVQDGAALCWGAGAFGRLGTGNEDASRVPVAVSGLGNGVTAIDGGVSHTCTIQNGAAYCWGWENDGRLGNGSDSNNSVTAPVQVSGMGSGVTAISAGQHHTCAIQNGGAFCWGLGSAGRLGNGSQRG